MTTATEPTPTSTTSVILERLVLGLARGGQLRVTGRTYHGPGIWDCAVTSEARHVPPGLFEVGTWMGLRSPLGPGCGYGLPDLVNAVTATWRIKLDFSKETDWQFRVPETDGERIGGALRTFPLPPSVLTDAGEEVTAFWLLAAPVLSLANLDRLIKLQVGLAVRLGADRELARRLDATHAVGGIWRCGGESPRTYVTYPIVDFGRLCTLEALEAAAEGTS